MAYDPTKWEHGDLIIANKLNKIESALSNISDNAVFDTDGLSPIGYVNSGDPMPANPKKGTTVFVKDGNDFLIYSFDGTDWVLKVDPELSNRIEETIKTASDNTDKAIADNNTQINETINQVAQEKIDLAIKDADFNENAQAMADKALADAKANTAQVAQDALNSANDSIAQAKSDITDAYKNADGVISKKVDDTATSIGNTISQNKIDSDGKISTAQSTATQALNEVTTKVSQTDYDKKTGDLTTAVSKAQTTADGVVTTVGNYKTSNDARVKAAESAISQNSNDITARVTKTDYDKATGKISGDISTLQQRADGFDATVTKVDNLSVGSRNLFLGTKDFSGNVNWVISGNLVKNVYQGLDAVQTASQWGGPKYNNSALESQGVIQSVDDKFVMSAWVRNTGTSPIAIYFYGDWLSLQNYKVIDLPANSGWVRINSQPFGFTQTSGLTGSIHFEPTTGSIGGNVQQVGLKLEKGTIATDWTPAPEDIESALAQVKVTADGVSSIVSNPTTGLSTRVQTAEGTLNTVKSTADGAMSKASQTANDVRQEISDRKTGDSNTLQSSKDFTVSSISSSEKGMQSLISQKADSVIVGTISDSVDQLKSVMNWQQISYDDLDFLQQTGNYLITQSANTNFPPGVTAWVYVKVEAPRSDRVTQTVWKDLNATQSYVRTFDGTNWSVWSQQVTSSTLLSIFKDSWSLGTYVNRDIGAQITSGIVGNASQMSLISKNVTIDSPSTQITGTAWINSAMIVDGSIGTAQILDAAITSAKIAQLDVAKLTGDVTSFVKSYWNSAYGNVTITPDKVSLQSYSGSNLVTQMDIGSTGISIKMPGIPSFLDSTLINANGMSFQHNNGSYATIGVMDSGFSLENNTYGGSPMSIRIGDGVNNTADNMAFAITASQSYGTSPQLIWAGSKVGKITTAYRTWDNPHGFILADDIKFSTWDNTASTVIFDETVNYQNWSPNQTYGYIDNEGNKRWFKVAGYNMSSTNRLVGIFGGDGKNGVAVDQTGDVWFSVKGKSYSLYAMLAKLNML